MIVVNVVSVIVIVVTAAAAVIDDVKNVFIINIEAQTSFLFLRITNLWLASICAAMDEMMDEAKDEGTTGAGKTGGKR